MSNKNSTTVGKNMPFDNYLNGGEKIYNIIVDGKGGSSRRGYGRRVFETCGVKCVYCGVDLGSSYELWLGISVDHVVPTSTLRSWGEKYREWLYDLSNCVTSCRACNEFRNQYKIQDAPPKDEAEFFAIRDRAFLAKRDSVAERHQEEKEWYKKWKSGIV